MGFALMLLAVPAAEATEYKLHPTASAVTVDGTLRLYPREIDVARVDYTVLVEFQNVGAVTLVVRTEDWRCARGDWVGSTGRDDRRPIVLPPGAVETMTLVCDTGAGLRGDFGLSIARVERDRTLAGAPAETLYTNLTWRLPEQDIFPARQNLGQPLAKFTFERPTPAPAAIPAPAWPPG
ncbi:MAG: hypothetical protein H0V89_04160 [Deltaproteobacteria bacterium]|nr:hypothetical protein [Deltaproteobacteria bacterium]